MERNGTQITSLHLTNCSPGDVLHGVERSPGENVILLSVADQQPGRVVRKTGIIKKIEFMYEKMKDERFRHQKTSS